MKKNFLIEWNQDLQEAYNFTKNELLYKIIKIRNAKFLKIQSDTIQLMKKMSVNLMNDR